MMCHGSLGSLKIEQAIDLSLLGAKGIATRNKDATRGSWPYY